jgi:hypothetical protein
MKNFKSLLSELNNNAPKEAVFTFGRFQGLTIGHEKLLDSLFAQPGDHFVFISQTKDDQKNPLTAEDKKKFLVAAYPENKKSFSIEYRTPFDALQSLIEKGYTKIKMIVGEDRVETFKSSFDGFDFPVEVKSAGNRSEDGSKVEQANGQAIRDLARAGALKDFNNLAMSKLDSDKKLAMFNEIRKAYGKDSVKISKAEQVREDYVAGKIFNLGDYVLEGTEQFKIIDRGANYVRVVNREGRVSRKWLTDIEPHRPAEKTFAESVKPATTGSAFSVNGYTPKFHSKAPVRAFEKSMNVQDQYALLEAVKETEKLFNSLSLKEMYSAFQRSGEFLEKLGVVELHEYRKSFETDIAKKLIENVSSIGEVFDHDKEKIVQFFADLVGVNKNLTLESTIQRCVNKINNCVLSEAEKSVFVQIIDVLITEGFEFDFYSLKFISECSVEEGTDRDLLLFADQLIESMTFEDIVPLYEEDDFVIITEAFGKKTVKVEQPLDDRKIQRKAKQIAVQYMKQRKSRKAVDQLTTAEKKKIEEIVGQKGSILTMISKKLGKKIKKIEAERLLPKEEPQPVELVKEEAGEEYVGIHYGKTPGVGSLSGSMWGTGAKGAEKERVMNSSDKRLRKRVYFYLQQTPNTLPKPEAEVSGVHVYRAKLNNIYDATNDPEGILKKRKPGTDLETAILDAGYDGYLNREFMGGAIVVLNKDKVDVDYLGTRSEAQEKVGPITAPNQEIRSAGIKRAVTPAIIDFRQTREGFESGLLKGDESLFLIKNKKEMAEKFPSYDMRMGRAFFADESEKDAFIEWYKEKTSTVTEDYEDWGEELTEETKYQGRTVQLNKPFRTPNGPKKFSVYVKNEKGNVVKVNFGDKEMEIRRDDPDRRKSFRARHKCDTQKDKTTPAYWSCRFWSSPKVSDLTK